MSHGIPSFCSSGRRLRPYSLSAIEARLALVPPSVVVTRNKRTGRITSATFVPLPRDSQAVEGKEPLRKTAHMGQRYSYTEPVDDAGHRAWRFAKFLTPGNLAIEDPDALERYLREIFRAVALSCLTIE